MTYFDAIEWLCDRAAPTRAAPHDVVTFVAFAVLWIAAAAGLTLAFSLT